MPDKRQPSIARHMPEESLISDDAVTAGLPIFMGHGSYDQVIPERLRELSRDALKKLGYDVEWHSYPMAHQVSPPEIADLRAWIGKRLATPSA